MPTSRESQRIVIAGASSLLGAELKSLLEESRFASWDLSLVDEETAVGTLTEAAGEPAVIQPVEEGTFSRAKLIFFAGSPAFTERNRPAARDSGAFVIDLSGAALTVDGACVWFALDGVPEGPQPSKTLYAVPSAPGLVAARLLDALGRVALSRLAIVFFRPVSEAGRAGIEELEAQTSQLLSFQSIGQPVFDTQVAFNLLDHYGSASRENLQAIRDRIRREASAASAQSSAPTKVLPSIQVLHAPVFYGYTFVANSDLKPGQTREALVEVLRKSGFSLEIAESSPLGNIIAAGDPAVHLALPEDDPAQPGTWWLWGAADNIRLPAATAIKLAEKLVA
jgi:aspartate-semialdehyde dehydrogenase